MHEDQCREFIRAIVDLLGKANLQQLRRLYIFIREYVDD